MIISLILLLFLAWNFYLGYSRGLFLQIFYVIGSVIAAIVAVMFKSGLADALYLWVPYANPTEDVKMCFFTQENIFSLNRLYYAGVAFLVIYAGVYLLFRFLGVFARGIKKIGQPTSLSNQIVAGVLAVVVVAFCLGAVFSLAATIPITALQNTLASSWLIRLLVALFPKVLFTM